MRFFLQLRLLGFALSVESLEFVGGVFCDVLDKVVDVSAAVVRHRLGVLLHPENGRESAHLELWRNVVGGGVHLDDQNILVGHLLAQFVVDWSQLLAMAAPRSVELDQDVLAAVLDQVVEVLADGDLDTVVVGLGDGLGLDVGLQLAALELLEELPEGLHVELVFHDVFQALPWT